MKLTRKSKTKMPKLEPRKIAKFICTKTFYQLVDITKLNNLLQTHGLLRSQLPKHHLSELPSGMKNHAFISYKQATAADMAGLLAERLANRGLNVWYDMGHKGNLAVPEMKKGIAQSKCYILLLTKGVFQSEAVCMEFETALNMHKPILFIHESQTNMPGFTPFSEYIDTVPLSAKGIFSELESMPFQRRNYLLNPFLEELIERVDKAQKITKYLFNS